MIIKHKRYPPPPTHTKTSARTTTPSLTPLLIWDVWFLENKVRYEFLVGKK